MSKQINYYELDKLDASAFKKSLDLSIGSIGNAVDRACIEAFNTSFLDKLANLVFSDENIPPFLLLLARLPVLSKDFEELHQDNLEVLSILKKLKFFVDLKIRETLYLLVKLSIAAVDEEKASKMDLGKFFSFDPKAPEASQIVDLKFKNAVKQKILFGDDPDKRDHYIQEFERLEKIEPHAIYPTSIYRQSDGCTVAGKDSKKIEAVMSTTLTSSIRISSHVLAFSSNHLAEIYRPIGRAVIVLDDKLDDITYTSGEVDMKTNRRVVLGMEDVSKSDLKKISIRQQLNRYFEHHGVKMEVLVRSGNEADKHIENVQEILIDLKKLGVMRNEPVLIVGGGVIADIAGFACALFHRNTPYVILATSIVAGIDAGPSPRTCCDGQGYKNAFGAFHPPVMTLTDRTLWRTMHEGMIRHGIAEIVKMAVVENSELFELLEKVGPKFLVKTKFGTDISSIENIDSIDLKEFDADCERVVALAMESYVRAEFGNLWETHQCRPHAYGHTWSPGYELPAGMLHGHAVATCMGFGAYISWKHCDWISEAQCRRICKLINDLELSLWHDIMLDKEIFHACTKKMVQKRGGNLAAPLPRAEIGECGYLNDITDEQLSQYVDEYRAYVTNGEFARKGYGVQPLLEDVGLADTSSEAQSHVRAEIEHDKENSAEGETNKETGRNNSESYQEWIKKSQKNRNSDWKMNVDFEMADDTVTAPPFPHNTLFHDETERYAMSQTTVASNNVRTAAKITVEEELFAPCMVGTLESQFLKMFTKISRAQTVLDVGTFTGMSAIAFAEGAVSVGHSGNTTIHTLESDKKTAVVAQKIFNACEDNICNSIKLHHTDAISWMKECAQDPNGITFDIIFIDADKDNYIQYYDLAMGTNGGLRPLLAENGSILADNTLSALVYDDDDSRRTALHQFNQHVKNDSRVEQAVMTVREGISIIARV